MDNAILRILWEVQNNAQWIATAGYNYSFEEFTKSQDTPYNLAMAFLYNYERPKEQYQPNRGIQANYWYEYLTGITPPMPLSRKKHKFKWVLYARKLRKNSHNFKK